MMTGYMYWFLPISNFWIQFIVSELVGCISVNPKEVLLMVIKVFREVKSFVNHLKVGISSFIVRHPYGENPLMSW
jgi:hypothetical protein